MHTKGPWEVKCESAEWPGIEAQKLSIVVFGWPEEQTAGIRGATLEEAHANAKLMAAAPDLLEALKWYVENDDVIQMEGNEFWLDGRERAREAIAKAT